MGNTIAGAGYEDAGEKEEKKERKGRKGEEKGRKGEKRRGNYSDSYSYSLSSL